MLLVRGANYLTGIIRIAQKKDGDRRDAQAVRAAENEVLFQAAGRRQNGGTEMKKPMKIALVSVGAVLAVSTVGAFAFANAYRTRFQTINSTEHLSNYDDGYNLYQMDVAYDYSIDDVINYGI